MMRTTLLLLALTSTLRSETSGVPDADLSGRVGSLIHLMQRVLDGFNRKIASIDEIAEHSRQHVQGLQLQVHRLQAQVRFRIPASYG